MPDKRKPRRDPYPQPRSVNSQDRGDFRCINCGAQVSVSRAVSGVNNRNHCPYCLFSKHVDDEHAGDRFAICHGRMEPVGLTMKRVRKKYGSGLGEVMLIHHCQMCDKISINRIAADDNIVLVYEVYNQSLNADPELIEIITGDGVELLGEVDRQAVSEQLFGRNQPDSTSLYPGQPADE